MKNILRASLVLLSITLVGCVSPQGAANQPMLNTVCIVSGEPIDAGVTADYMGGKVGFCCDKCLDKWNKMDDAGKKAAVAAKPQK